MRWCIDTGYPLDGPEPDLQGIMSGLSESAGSGFGMRDEQWYVESRTRAYECAMACARELGVEINAEIDPQETKPYVAVYWEPKWIIFHYIKNRDFEALRYDVHHDGWWPAIKYWVGR